MTPEEKVLNEIKEKVAEFGRQITQMAVASAERKKFEEEKARYQVLVREYKEAKKRLEEREAKCNSIQQ